VGLDILIRSAIYGSLIAGIVALALRPESGNMREEFSFPNALPAGAAETRPALADEGPMPDFGAALPAQPMPTSNDKERFMPEAIAWLNSAPVSSKSLRGKVVLVDFWTYSCINSLRNLAYVKSWAAKYKNAGFVVIGVHTPEFSFEKQRQNVETAVRDLNVTYPVAIDSGYRIWQAFNNEYWPADYFIDGKGRIRYHHFGEGEYAESERVIQELLAENGAAGVSASTVSISPQGVEVAPNWPNEESPETYIGYRHGTEHFASPERLVRDAQNAYSLPASLALNQWALAGSWHVGVESGVLATAPGKILFRFHSRDLHFVLGPAKSGNPVHFKVKLDGAAPGDEHGVDSGPDGSGVIRGPRLYQLIRQKGQVRDRTFEIEFLDPGVAAYVVTFG
jgi:thiol-disulfide isomerase/thioredoxin